ncbi:MAG: hypothetical protein HQK53_12570 [Oligoflexia bacterium]|nr:hypothetical protein [Oligoflexia bacterium]
MKDRQILKQHYKYFSEVLVAHSDLVSQLAIWLIDSIFLVGKLFPHKFPRYVGDASFMALNYVGIIAIPFQTRCLIKNFQDTIFSFNRTRVERQNLVALASLLSGICIAVGIVDIFAMSFTATLITFGDSQQRAVTSKIFTILIPMGSVIISLLILLEIYRILMNRHILKRMNMLLIKDNSSHLVAKIIVATFASASASLKNNIFSRDECKHANECSEFSYAIDLAIKIRMQMDVNTWIRCQQTIEHLDLSNSSQLLEYINGPVRNDILIGSADNFSNLGLRAVGYAGMAIGRAYPNSLPQALAYWSISTLYGVKNFAVKLLQAWQRQRMRLIIIKKLEGVAV